MTLNELLAVQRGAALLRRAVHANGELDMDLLAAESQTVAELVGVLAGEGACSRPLHEVIRDITEQLPGRLTGIADYVECELEPELKKLAELLKPFADVPKPKG